MKSAVGYIRVSSYGQLSTEKKYKHSFRRQSEAINEYAKKNKYEVIQFFFDCITGETPFDKRPGGLLLLQFLEILKKRGQASEVIVEDMSRFGRTVEVTNSIDRLPFTPISASEFEKVLEEEIFSILRVFFQQKLPTNPNF